MTQPAPEPTPTLPPPRTLAEAQARSVAQAPPPPQASGDVDIIVDGKPWTVPRSGLQTALDAGATLPTPAQVGETAEPGSLLGSLKATEIAFGSSLAGGIIPGAIYGTAKHIDPEWARGWRDNYEAAKRESEADHPYASALGTGLGMATDALSPAGKALGGGVGAATRGLGTGALATIARGGLEAAAQQSVYNAGKQFSEDELGDADLNAEKMFMHAAGAMLDASTLEAGVLGGGFSALGVGGGKLLRALKGPASHAALDAAVGVEGAGRAVAGEAREAQAFAGDMQKLGMTGDQAAGIAHDLDGVAKAKGPLTSIYDDALEPYITRKAAMTADPAEAAARMRMQLEGGVEATVKRAETIDASARELSTHADDVLRTVVDNVDDVQFAQKADQIRKLVDPTKAAEALDAARLASQQLREQLAPLGESLTRDAGHGRMVKAIDELDRKLAKIGTADRDGAAAAFLALDDAKRGFGKVAQFGKGPFGLSESGRFADDAYHQILRPALENEGAWGAAGAAQRASNEAATNFLSKSGAFKSAFGAVELNRAAGRPVLETDPGKFKSFLRSLGGAEGDKPRQVLREYLGSVVERANAAKAHFDIPAAQLAEMDRGVASAQKMLTKLDAAEKQAVQIAKLEQSVAGEAHAGGASAVGSAVGGAIGGLVGSLGGYAGAGAGAFVGSRVGGFVGKLSAAPYKALQDLSHIRRIVEIVDDKVLGGVKGILGGTKGGVAPPAPRPRLEVINEIEGLHASAANDTAMHSRIVGAIGPDLHDAAPKHAAALATTMARAVTYLASKAPQGRATVGLLPSANQKLRYSDHDLETYERTAAAVRNPDKVIADASQGRLSREGVSALSAVYPKLYAQLQNDVMERLVDLDQRGELDSMPYQQRLLLGTLLQIPADASQHPDMIAAIQKLKAEDQGGGQKPKGPPQGGGRRPFKLDASSYQTEAGSIEAGGRVG